jgi:hypothetical protein
MYECTKESSVPYTNLDFIAVIHIHNIDFLDSTKTTENTAQ